ncbi:probable LRR receptor-like serine/threonine-protein kinase RFK1 [Hevea brasiliensis]|uniref:probable LRR receptor-like serine/threonine-protein kinase RFK1 n=1 Tax=Hevea brasiliensis TaxID=3981 RepID=UPI0025F2AC2B|nr:probable LRR receptor-like serine/threonine-protein kinase RFK1 [Hevea brasiliensis]
MDQSRRSGIEDLLITGRIPQYIGDWPSLTYLFLTRNMLTGSIPSWISSVINDEADNAASNFYVDPNGKWAYACSGDFSKDDINNPIDYIRNTTSESSIFETDMGPLYKAASLCPVSLCYYGFCLRNSNYTVKLHFNENTFARDSDNAYKILEQHFKVCGEKLSPRQIAGIVVGAVLTPLLVLAFMWKMGCLKSKELQSETLYTARMHTEIHIEGKSFTLQQIIDATRNFNSKMEIGKGRYGIVYKAELPDEIKLAVKKISPDINQQEKNELKSEIFSLKSLRHENVVQLLDGYCDKKGLYLLIYEYMDNGSLHQALFSKGLKYLHEEKRFDIVHGNIKAANILLDKSYTAKLSDFGLARLCREEDPFVSIIKARASRCLQFGVVLLEIVSGKISADHARNGENDFLLDKISEA